MGIPGGVLVHHSRQEQHFQRFFFSQSAQSQMSSGVALVGVARAAAAKKKSCNVVLRGDRQEKIEGTTSPELLSPVLQIQRSLRSAQKTATASLFILMKRLLAAAAAAYGVERRREGLIKRM